MSYEWTEISQGVEAPAWTLAGRSDEPVTTRGDAVAAVVQRASAALNDASVNHAIARRRAGMDRELDMLFAGHRNGGILAVAELEVQRFGEMSGRLFHYLSCFPGVYARPEHAIYRWTHRPRLSAGWGNREYRFFWITRAEED